jgi:uncharacterized membrane protein YhaH (DUF805 family)
VLFAEAIQSFFVNYANFHGRARRSEFWWITLFLFVSQLLVVIVDHMTIGQMTFFNEKGHSFLPLLWNLITFIPMLALWTRRLHDVGKRGYLLLLWFVPFGFILYIMRGVQESTPANQWGPPANGGKVRIPYLD